MKLKRVASVVVRVLMALIHPAYYSAFTLLVLQIIGAIDVPWQVICSLGCFPALAIVVDIIVGTIYPSSPITEPGGTPGTED